MPRVKKEPSPDSPWVGRAASRYRAAVLAESDICHLCGKPGADSVDHIIPKSRRPDLTWDPENLAPAHLRCNVSRGSKTMAQYRQAKPKPRPKNEELW